MGIDVPLEALFFSSFLSLAILDFWPLPPPMAEAPSSSCSYLVPLLFLREKREESSHGWGRKEGKDWAAFLFGWFI
jgi:hypothetical protein